MAPYPARLLRRGYKIAVSGAVAIHELHDLARERRAQTATLANPIEDLSSFLGPYPLEDLRATGQRPIERHPLVGGARRPRIALVIDEDYWAFGNIARQLCRYLSDRFEFRVIPASIVSRLVQILILAEECDIIHFFWRDKLRAIGSPSFRRYAESLGFRYSDFEKRFLSSKVITTSVYDHLFLDVDDLPKRRDLYNARIAGYSVASEKLNIRYSGLVGYPAPSALTEDGVDLTLFKPARLERFRTISERELVVGWAGNSAWAAHREDFKGVHTILNPALEDLAREGYRIRPFFADSQTRYIAHTEMPQYYSKVDLYICTSKVEGTPNPVLEAMACGVPIVSTDVGIVPQAFGELQKQFIMQERSKEALKDLIKELVDDPLLFSRLSRENLESVKSWDWSIKAEKFADFFKQMYARSRPTSGDDRPD